MEHLTLTNTHKPFLLEMAKYFFKEQYDEIDNPTFEPVGLSMFGPAGTAGTFVYFYRDSGAERIHWYEFCLNNLIDEMEKVSNLSLKTQFFNICILEKEKSIIDYLYDQYKFIKSEKDYMNSLRNKDENTIVT